jgi:transcriptional regulator GlxA family with amidase domain
VTSWLTGLIAEAQPAKPRRLRGNALKVAKVLIDGPMTSDQIAKSAGLSISQVREVFRQHLGEEFESSPVSYSLKPTIVGEVAGR